MHDLRVWPGVEGDGSDPSKTPGKRSGKEDEMSRLAKVRLNVLYVCMYDIFLLFLHTLAMHSLAAASRPRLSET